MLLRRLHLQVNLSRIQCAAGRELVAGIIAELPFHAVAPIELETSPELTVRLGLLLVSEAKGTPVHAATFLRDRRIVIETKLLSDCSALRFVLVHELLHFGWLRLGNTLRSQFASLLHREVQSRAAGELGDSSSIAKERWKVRPASPHLWKNYVCESFCDTGASLYSAAPREAQLAPRWMQRREHWFAQSYPPSRWRC